METREMAVMRRIRVGLMIFPVTNYYSGIWTRMIPGFCREVEASEVTE